MILTMPGEEGCTHSVCGQLRAYTGSSKPPLSRLFCPPSAKVSGCWLPTGPEGGGKPQAAGSEKEGPLPLLSSAPHTQGVPSGELPSSCAVSGEKPLSSEAPGVLRGADAAGGSKAVHRERAQPQGEGGPLPRREAKAGKRPLSPGPGNQKSSTASSPASPSPPSTQTPHNPVPCGSGRGSCHLANLLSTLAQNSQNTDPKRPPEVTCQARKKTRTLYRSGESQKVSGRLRSGAFSGKGALNREHGPQRLRTT